MFLPLPTMNPILIAAAVIPAVFLLLRIYRADRLDKEPTQLLAGLVLMGIISTSLAMLTERLGTFVIGLALFEGSFLYDVLLYFLVVGLSEEGFKYLLLRVRTWNNPHFNCQFDAVVYATFVSLGFALWENISYVASYGLGTALVRAVTAVPGHACFGVFMGAFYGVAKKYDNAGQKDSAKTYRTLAVVVPVLLHGTYDFIAASQSVHSAWAFAVFVGIMFYVACRLVKKMAATDRYIDGQQHLDDLWNFGQ